jgi:hypothetical protein
MYASVDPFIQLTAAIALLVTALLGIAGYVVQNKASITANATQHELIQEAAERQRAEEKAGKQLDRVQLQNSEFIYPMNSFIVAFIKAYERATFECGCENYTTTYAFEWISPPTQPYATVLNAGKPETFKAVAANPFVYTLPPPDLARLAAEPSRRARWEELVSHTFLPPLRQLLPILQTKVRRDRTPSCHCHAIRLIVFSIDAR